MIRLAAAAVALLFVNSCGASDCTNVLIECRCVRGAAVPVECPCDGTYPVVFLHTVKRCIGTKPAATAPHGNDQR